MIRKIASFLFLISVAALLGGQALTHEQAEQRASALLKQMTLDEKVGQLNQSAGIQMPMLGSDKPDDLIAQGRVGSVLWLVDTKEINRLSHIAVEKSRLHIPILFAFDVIHVTGRPRAQSVSSKVSSASLFSLAKPKLFNSRWARTSWNSGVRRPNSGQSSPARSTSRPAKTPPLRSTPSS